MIHKKLKNINFWILLDFKKQVRQSKKLLQEDIPSVRDMRVALNNESQRSQKMHALPTYVICARHSYQSLVIGFNQDHFNFGPTRGAINKNYRGGYGGVTRKGCYRANGFHFPENFVWNGNIHSRAGKSRLLKFLLLHLHAILPLC